MTTPNVNQSLSDIFDVELTATDKSVGELKIAAKVESIDSLEARRSYVKGNIVSLIERGMLALDSITNIANSTEEAKDFNEVTKLIKTLVETNMTLLECEVIHKNPKPDTGSGMGTTNNNVYVGSTADLARYIKDSKNIVENK